MENKIIVMDNYDTDATGVYETAEDVVKIYTPADSRDDLEEFLELIQEDETYVYGVGNIKTLDVLEQMFPENYEDLLEDVFRSNVEFLEDELDSHTISDIYSNALVHRFTDEEQDDWDEFNETDPDNEEIERYISRFFAELEEDYD